MCLPATVRLGLTVLLGLTLQRTGATSEGTVNPVATCSRIAQSVSSQSSVFGPGTTRPFMLNSLFANVTYVLGSVGYTQDNAHYFESSSAPSACSVEPDSAADVGVIVGSTIYILG